MTFDEVLDQAIDMLHRRGRLTYRTLKRQFNLDDEALADLSVELIKGQRLARDEDEEVLVWIGEAYTPTQIPHPETDGETRFHAVLPFVLALLQREQRVTYRLLKRCFWSQRHVARGTM